MEIGQFVIQPAIGDNNLEIINMRENIYYTKFMDVAT